MERIAIIAALGTKTRAVGKDNALLWHISDDMRRFKELTMGHPVIIGAKPGNHSQRNLDPSRGAPISS